MSRVGKKPVKIPDKAQVKYTDNKVVVNGKKGTLSRAVHPSMKIVVNDGEAIVEIESESRQNSAYQGLTRSLLANMIEGVTSGFTKRLEINGIGYRAEVKGKEIIFNLGYSHPINFPLPEGITANVDRAVLTLDGIDKELLGQTAASIRKLRPPEPYKGKGIKYVEERIIRKAGKTGTK